LWKNSNGRGRTMEKGTSIKSSENGKGSDETEKGSAERRERRADRRAVKRSERQDFKRQFFFLEKMGHSTCV